MNFLILQLKHATWVLKRTVSMSMQYKCLIWWLRKYSKTCVKRTLKNRQNKDHILMTNGSLMKVEIIAECSPWSTLQ